MRLASFLLFLIVPTYALSAEYTLKIADYYGSETYPSLHRNIVKAAKTADIEIQFSKLLPANRALHMAAIGKLDGDIMRHPSAVADYPNLIQVKPAILKLDYWIWVNSNHDCPKSMAHLKQLTPVGLLGFKYFEIMSKKLSTEVMMAPTMDTFINMLTYHRANYTIVIERIAKKLMQEKQLQLTKCFSKPYETLNGYLYVHKKHKHLIPKLENAFKTMFTL